MRKKLLEKAGAILLSLSMILTSGVWTGEAQAATKKKAAETKMGNIVLNGNDIKKDNINGLTFKGFGILSGNSTSDLLMDYKAENPEAYGKLMQYLFGGKYPIMNHVKLEMGNDRNTSTGPEAATKRYKEEKANVKRNPGWQLAADAKKINPNLKVSILSWTTPAWVKTAEDKYTWYKESILAGYETYGFMVDYINPNTNESWRSTSDVENTKKFASWIKGETKTTIPDEKALALFHKIKLVISDEAGTVSDSVGETLKSDTDFYNSVDVVGYHYSPHDDSTGSMKWLADEMDKEVWNSEAQATFSNSAFRPANNVQDPSTAGTGIGGVGSALEMGNTFIKGFVESRRSHIIYQPGIGSFYEGGQYSFKELVSARDPWSGWIHYDAGLLVLAHLSKFAVTGWENEDNTAGIWRGVPQASKSTAEGTNPVNGRNGGENYITVASPDKDNFSTMVVNDSEYPMTYTLETQNMNLDDNAALELWETRAADEGAFNENYMKCLGNVTKNEEGVYTFEVKPYSTVTITSLDVSDSQEHTEALPVEGERLVLDTDATGNIQNTEDGYLYGDDFEYKGKTVPVLDGKGGFTGETQDYISARGGDTGAMARYTHTLNGAFETYKTKSGEYVLRQQLDKDTYGLGNSWNSGDPATLIGDFRWANYTASVDVCFEKSVEKQYAAIGIRQFGTSHKITNSSGYTLKVMETGEWKLYRQNKEVATGTASTKEKYEAKAGRWFQLKLRGAGNKIQAYINNVLVAEYEDASPITVGRVALGCSHTFTQFDNLAVTKINGYAPYYTEALDNMEIYDLSAEKNSKLVYNNKWSHTNGQGMYVYQRSISKSTGVGAALTYTFTGTGMEIIGKNSDTGNTVNVIVDGTQIKEKDSIQNASMLTTAYRIDGLEYGEHTVTVEVAEGSLDVDMVGVLGQVYQGAEIDVQPKENVVVNPPKKDDTPDKKTEATLKKGTIVKVGNGKYKVTNAGKKTVDYRAAVKTKATSITIPSTVKIKVQGKSVTYKVTGVSAKAFTKCRKLKKVTIGKNIKSIGKEAFKNCKSLKKITVKSKVLKSVGKNAIKGIHKKAVIRCGKKAKAYKKLFSSKTDFKKTMKIKK